MGGKAETRIFSHRLSTVRESQKITGSQVSYILVYTDSVVALAYTDNAAAFEPTLIVLQS